MMSTWLAVKSPLNSRCYDGIKLQTIQHSIKAYQEFDPEIRFLSGDAHHEHLVLLTSPCVVLHNYLTEGHKAGSTAYMCIK